MARKNSAEPSYLCDLRDSVTAASPKLGQIEIWRSLKLQPHYTLDHLEEKRYMFVMAHPDSQDIPAFCACQIDNKFRAIPRMGPIPFGKERATGHGRERLFYPGAMGTNATGATVPKGCYFWLQTQGQIMRDGKEWDRL